jgi:hypothetical protein
MPQIVSANRLADGIIVFLAKGDAWVERLSDAELFADKAGAEAGLARAQAAMEENLVVEITPFDVEMTLHGPTPTHIRDRIRAAGPTVRLDHGKQAG